MPGTLFMELTVEGARSTAADLDEQGFILMIDEFRPDNGATRFAPGSPRWPVTAIPRNGRAGCDFAARMEPETRARLSPLAHQVLAL